MKYIFAAIMIMASAAASAERVDIPWMGDYAHNFDATYSPENKYRSGWSKNFLNGTPQEGGRVERDGVLRAELITASALECGD
jgi:hypothetical protein